MGFRQSLEMTRFGGQLNLAVAPEITIDLLPDDHLLDGVHCRIEGPIEGAGPFQAVLFRNRRKVPDKPVVAVSAVAPGRGSGDAIGLEDDDIDPLSSQAEGCRETGETTSDDGHVAVRRHGTRSTGREGRSRIEPVGTELHGKTGRPGRSESSSGMPGPPTAGRRRMMLFPTFRKPPVRSGRSRPPGRIPGIPPGS